MKKTKGIDAMIDIMLHHGVEYVFGISGATEVVFMDALEKQQCIKYILGLNEIVCIGMAEGYARASDKPGFLNLHTGPGLAAAMPFLADAKNAGVPLVVTVGQNDSRLLQYEPQLSGNIIGMAKHQTKWCTEIYHASDIPAVMHRAFKYAMQPPTGPVLISIPQNVLLQDLDYEPRTGTKVYSRIRGDSEALEKAASLLQKARNPVMIVEGGVTQSGALDETVKFAELIGARVYQVWMTDVNFPVNHPQYFGDLDSTSPLMRKLLKESDLIIGIGCSMFFDAFYSEEPTCVPSDLKVIHIHPDPWELGKNFPIDCGIQGDIKTTLSELISMLEKSVTGDYLKEAEKRKALMKEETDRIKAELEGLIEAEKANCPISVSSLASAIRTVMTPDMVLVDDSWSSSRLIRHVPDLTQPGSYFRARGGSIGFGLPGAMGVSLAQPGKKVLAVAGDGSAAWSMQSFWTAAHYRIPVTFVITNNATYRQVKIVRAKILGDYPLDELHLGLELNDPVIDFCQLAQSMGVKGYKVVKPDDLVTTLRTALESGAPSLVEVYTENKPTP